MVQKSSSWKEVRRSFANSSQKNGFECPICCMRVNVSILVNERTCCSQSDSKYECFRWFSICVRVCTPAELKMNIDGERVRVESTFREHESAAARWDSVGRWTSASARRCRVR